MNRKLVQTALALLTLCFLLPAPRPQQAIATLPQNSQEDRIALYQALLDLTNPWTVMCIAAHPDDEDGTSLIVMRRKYGAHTVSLFSTFGEGGQNAIGPELYEELGAIRARETMAAAEIQGSEPHFLGLKDFGFSKSADEAFKFWGHEEALRRMVLEIRKLRPDVIITNHSVTSNDHGHHQATARLVVEAFDAAADPKRFPEQLKDGVVTWQVQRLFVRARGNQAQADNATVVTIDPNERDPVRGVVYAEEALRALQKHATQGPWPKTFAEFANRFRAFSGQSGAPGQLPLIRYALVREAKGAAPLTNTPQNFLSGMQLPPAFANEFQNPTVDGRPLMDFVSDRARVLQTLIDFSERVRLIENIQSSDYPRLIARTQKFQEAVRVASGVKLTISTDRRIVTPGFSLKTTVIDSNDGDLRVRVDTGKVLNPHSSLTENKSETVRQDWTFNSDPLYRDRSRDMEIKVTHRIEIGSLVVPVSATTHVTVVPPVEMTSPGVALIVITPSNTKHASNGDGACGLRDVDFKLNLTNNQDTKFSGELIVGPAGSVIARAVATRKVTLPAHAKTDLMFTIPGCRLSDANGAVRDLQEFSFILSPKEKTKELSRLSVPVVRADAKVAINLSVGYIRGFDYSLPNALNALGVESKELTVDEVKTADLSKYTSVIVDNRVYESQPELIAANQKLLDYANAGGMLIVFYHKSDEWNPDTRRNRPQLAPYKLILGNERITDENAPITFLEPKHPLLNLPNKMGQEDFAGWIQERGLYYPKDWDPQFHALLQANDPGEAPLKGGLLVADYGRGHYIYTSMVWYRELRGGVPGAYRMLANMISYGRASR